MSVKFKRTGMVQASGEIGENLIKESFYASAPWKNALSSNVVFQGKECMAVAHHVLYSQNINNVRDIFPDMVFQENTQYTISIEWGENRSDDKYGSWYIRFLYTDGTKSDLISNGSHDLHKSTMTSTAGKTVQHIVTTYGNGGITYFRNFKIEQGTKATPWCPNENDAIYVGSNHGFIENGDMMKIYENAIETTEFIEY